MDGAESGVCGESCWGRCCGMMVVFEGGDSAEDNGGCEGKGWLGYVVGSVGAVINFGGRSSDQGKAGVGQCQGGY